MKFHPVEQGHVDWFKLRMGRVTASELGNLISPTFELRTGEMPKTYVYTKLSEMWRGKPMIFTGSWATEQGEVREEEAIPWLALEKEWKIREGGFIESDDGLSGCSPDGLVGDDLGIECKSPEPVNHVRWLVEGVLPKSHAVQVHTSMYVTGFPRWLFYSYNRGFPAFILEVRRDEAIISKIDEAVKRFHEQLEAAKTKLSAWGDPAAYLK
jgi:hypothetical protein